MLGSAEELMEEAAAFVGRLQALPHTATLVTLSGELGAGKTTFTQGIAKAFGVEGSVTSPTFVLEKIYALPETAPFRRLAHIDAYRLNSGIELAPLGFDELMQDKDTLVVLEWPEKVADSLPAPTHALQLTVVPEGRKLVYG